MRSRMSWRGCGGQITAHRPSRTEARELVNPPILAGKRPQTEAGKALRPSETTGTRKDAVGDAHADVDQIEGARCLLAFLIDDLRTQFDEHFRNVDLDRADFVAGSAERRRVRQGLGVLHLHELRGQDCADWAAVDRAVGVATGLPVNRAGVLAGAATDAAQGLTLDGPRENV